MTEMFNNPSEAPGQPAKPSSADQPPAPPLGQPFVPLSSPQGEPLGQPGEAAPPSGQPYIPAAPPSGDPLTPPDGRPIASQPSAQPPAPPAGQPVAPSSSLQPSAMPPAQSVVLQAEEKRHVHHSYMWLAGIAPALTVAGVIAFTLIATLIEEGVSLSSGQNNTEILLIVLGVVIFSLILFGLIIGAQVLSYRNLYYELGSEEFNVYSGIFTKRRIHVPYQRIQSVNQRASLLQRLAGVCTLNIDTAGGSTNKAVMVPYVQKAEAERLRNELFARKRVLLSKQAALQGQVAAPGQAVTHQQGAAASLSPAYPPGVQPGQASPSNVLDMPAQVISDMRGVFDGEQVDLGAVSYEYGLSNKELVLTGFSNSTGFAFMVLAIIGGIMSLVGWAIQTALGQTLLREGVNWAMGLISSNFVGVIVALVLITMAVLWALSIIGTCISYGGFKASRRATRIEVEHGLLQHQFHGVDIDRVQSVIIKQGFLRRIFGYCELSLGKIDAVTAEASEGQKNTAQKRGLVVHPFVKLNRVPTILAGLVPEFADVPTEQIKLPKVSLRRALIRRCILFGNGFWLAVLVAAAQIVINVGAAQWGILDSYWSTTGLSTINYICVGLYALSVVLLAVDIVGAVLWFRGSSFAYNQHFMQITNGGFSRESISYPRKKIQFGTVGSNPLQRRKHVATISTRSAAGIVGTTTLLVDVSEYDADAWLDWLIPGGNRQKITS